jgi:hypothetical protein
MQVSEWLQAGLETAIAGSREFILQFLHYSAKIMDFPS